MKSLIINTRHIDNVVGYSICILQKIYSTRYIAIMFFHLWFSAWLVLSCNGKEGSDNAMDDVSGVYVRESETDITNLESGRYIGKSQFRDTIFIEQNSNGYQVYNHKWRLNNYDREGWVNMLHSDSRPLPMFQASYDKMTGQLISQNPLVSPALYVDTEKKALLRNTARNVQYVKVK